MEPIRRPTIESIWRMISNSLPTWPTLRIAANSIIQFVGRTACPTARPCWFGSKFSIQHNSLSTQYRRFVCFERKFKFYWQRPRQSRFSNLRAAANAFNCQKFIRLFLKFIKETNLLTNFPYVFRSCETGIASLLARWSYHNHPFEKTKEFACLTLSSWAQLGSKLKNLNLTKTAQISALRKLFGFN